MFTSGQMIRFFILYLLSSSISFLIQPLLLMADYQGWIGIIGGYVISLVIAFVAVRLAMTYVEEKWLNFGKRILGSKFHRLFLILFFSYVLILCVINIQKFTDFFGFIYLQGTPYMLLISLFVFCTTMVATSGMKAIFYLSDIFFLPVIVSMVIIMPFLFTHLNFSMSIALITHFDWYKFLKSSFLVSNWFGDLVFVLFITPYLKVKSHVMKHIVIATTSALLLLISYWMMSLFLLGPELGGNINYPVLELLRHIGKSEFTENLDPLLISIWLTTLLIKISFFIFLMSLLARQLFSMQTKKQSYICYAVGLTVIILTTFVSRFPAELNFFINHYLNIFLFGFKTIPIIYLIAYYFRLHGKKQLKIN